MNDQQIILALLAFYRDKGVDLSYLLDDPAFNSLSTSTKVSAIKAMASELHDGVNGKITKLDFKNFAANMLMKSFKGAVAGGTVGLSLAKPVGVSLSQSAIAGAALGGVAGILTGAMDGYSPISARRAVKSQLEQVVKDPSDSNAIGVLSIRGIHNRNSGPRNSILNQLSNTIDSTAYDKAIPWTIKTTDEQVKAIDKKLAEDIANLHKSNNG